MGSVSRAVRSPGRSRRGHPSPQPAGARAERGALGYHHHTACADTNRHPHANTDPHWHSHTDSDADAHGYCNADVQAEAGKADRRIGTANQ